MREYFVWIYVSASMCKSQNRAMDPSRTGVTNDYYPPCGAGTQMRNSTRAASIPNC